MRNTQFENMSENVKMEEHVDSGEKKVEGARPKSFSINSILARVEKEKKQEENVGDYNSDELKDDKVDSDSEEKNKDIEDVPAIVSKLEFPVFPGLGRGFADLGRHGDTGAAGLLPLSHLPAWYHWYASQQSLQHWQHQQQQHKKCKWR